MQRFCQLHVMCVLMPCKLQPCQLLNCIHCSSQHYIWDHGLNSKWMVYVGIRENGREVGGV